MLEYYKVPNVREICHRVKEGDRAALKEMAASILKDNFIPERSILIPAPSHTGRATYTLELSRLIAEKTGAKVQDILRCKPHISRYEEKKRGIDSKFEFYLIRPLIKADKTFFVDNVISTGKTFSAARELIGNTLIPLVYSIDSTRVDKKYFKGVDMYVNQQSNSFRPSDCGCSHETNPKQSHRDSLHSCHQQRQR